MLCSICDNKLEIKSSVYQGLIRTGPAGGGGVDGKVYECMECGSWRLADAASLDPSAYLDDTYRVSVGHEVSLEDFLEKKGSIDQLHFEACQGIPVRLDKPNILDVGCGPGSFIERYFGGVAGATLIGVEPTVGYHPIMVERGILPFQFADDCKDFLGEIDLAFSFHVIEHVEYPVDFLNSIYDLLKPGGVAFIATPNRDDILLKVVPEFASFWYRSSHLWYFDCQSIDYVVRKSKFDNHEVSYFHTLDFSNFCWWLNKGSANINNSNIFENINNFGNWNQFLNAHGLSDSIYLRVEKTNEDSSL